MPYNNSEKEKKLNTKKVIKKEGTVIEALPNTFFRVKLDEGKEILAFLSGKLRIHRIRILTGDRVSIEMTPYDEEKGRIVYRLR
ncbi:MAG: translation initiation factor IF-1 [Candidatus Staskawiczbacteria bacterium CG10_big_fil_rev_8_21_14_0_10_38_10]|uniref:Translation initiation factor IF-1 n=1 Tax=Candidatus Staskawiczbacteria bacterium CG10_big_fil_rev_8_21_14_0_10_38_10 TaxID=1974891 RepID=A0A2H9T1K6_9BACT|nr:MAG: translation initiation factor IF-1 [Candidatus Staskawiczbacteria bacterium CG10_big_fil_rev_8_21_14_0_10_38_10]